VAAAINKTDLRHVAHKEFEEFQAQLDVVPERLKLCPDGEDSTLKDIVGHRAHWIALFLGQYAKGQAGVPMVFPAEGYKWNDLKRYNAGLRAAQADLDWNSARSMLAHNHALLIDWIEARSGQEPYRRPDDRRKQRVDPGPLGGSGRAKPLPLCDQVHPRPDQSVQQLMI
jgi:hypothetical protein